MPQGLYSDRVVGFLMPRVKGMHSILDFTIPDPPQKCPFFNYTYLHRTARNLAAAFWDTRVDTASEMKRVISVSDTALVTLVDTDSFKCANLIKVLFTLPCW